MAKKKKRRGRASLLTKAINAGVMLIAFARPLQILSEAGFSAEAGKRIAIEATGGATGGGGINTQFLMQFYGPMVGAIILKKAISMVRRTARV